ncbi:hypothetical protein INT46_009710 [Mucor plumbeus]|uniref:SHSP domain-containing protein n=1 Tax=Mucor plumbeus TaxID=97098 RepID=A0A8H7V972_9FUNG|nr:hypothetical protein INT46_009710 [Mucor plumbeus]
MSLTNRVFSDALRDMQRAMAAFDQPLLSSAPFSSSLFRHQYPSTDMVETPDAYELHAELPGYEKKDIKIEMSDSHTLVISGNVNKEYKTESPSDNETAGAESSSSTAEGSNEQQVTTTKKDDEKQVGKHTKGHKWLVQERSSGSFVRSFALPVSVKRESIKASYNNGVLKVVIPKDNDQKSNQINIE